MAKQKTGSVWYDERHGGYAVQITYADGTRSPIKRLTPTARSPQAEQRAREVALEWTQIATAERHSRAARPADIGVPAEPVPEAETCAKWFERFHALKEKGGLSSVGDMRGRARNWVLPGIAGKRPREITREDIEAIVRRLDAAIVEWHEHDGERGEGRLSPSSATNIWGDVVHAFDEMVRAKDPALRVLTANPARDVRGPETGPDREGPILYSDEIVALLHGKAVDDGQPDVPLYRRQTWAMAVYTKARRSELAAVTAADVDLAHATITISKQVDRKSKTRSTKKTKTKRTRTVDVEPNAHKLVEELVARPRGKYGRLLRMPPNEDYAELLRKDLWTVGVRDARLHTEDSTRTKLTGHCLRDPGLTHMAVRGDSPIVIQWAGGHTDFKMTQGYIDRGRVEARRIGEPLPPLPPNLLAESLSESLPRSDGPGIAGLGSGGATPPPALASRSAAIPTSGSSSIPVGVATELLNSAALSESARACLDRFVAHSTRLP